MVVRIGVGKIGVIHQVAVIAAMHNVAWHCAGRLIIIFIPFMARFVTFTLSSCFHRHRFLVMAVNALIHHDGFTLLLSSQNACHIIDEIIMPWAYKTAVTSAVILCDEVTLRMTAIRAIVEVIIAFNELPPVVVLAFCTAVFACSVII